MRQPRTQAVQPSWRGQQWSTRYKATSRRERIFRWIRLRRRLFAALLLCAAAAVAVQQLTPASPITTTVLLAARDLPAGHTLEYADLFIAKVSPTMVPDGILAVPESANGTNPASAIESYSVAGWVGRQVSGPVRRGEVMTDAALLGKELLVGAPPGSQAVPLRLNDPTTVQLLRQGQLVNVVLSSSNGMDGPVSNEVLAYSIPVLWAPAFAVSTGGLMPSQDTDGLVVVAATASQATLLAGASAKGKIFLVLVS